MADYYSHRDPRQKGDAYLDYGSSSGVGWIWAVVVLVAIVALIALGSSGGVEGTADGATAPAAATDTTTIEAPAATTAPAATDQ